MTTFTFFPRIRYTLTHLMRLRLWLLRAELHVRGIPHLYRGGDGVAVLDGGQWFDVYPFLRDSHHRHAWVVDHPHVLPDDEFAGLEIGRCAGFRFPITALPAMWADFTGTDAEDLS
ncbi:hypothetical protein F3087_00725 [Nocardia colli]|uniref:Uncharacterized protein n=1 Tax=Nocardia colli TaxID=2545717 RepID=A0A5N0ELX1_9NOCA|nr:hypothetical protein [Nocardia colli]KAA8889886.1 hypothetical protein F3087_00725 [Nocardia colli]